jgi:hypothetical protein
MFLKILKKYSDFIKRIDSRKDDEIIVTRFGRFEDILQPDEEILWQGAPSASDAWADHDQMEPAGSAGDRPGSLAGRRVEMILALLFILFMFFLGAGFFFSGVSEILQKQDLDTIAPSIFLILVGTTFMSGLPFLLRPVSNRRRARRLTYILTTSRAMIVRHGRAWAEIWVRSAVIISVSLLFLYGVILFSGLFLEGVYRDAITGAGLNAWLARGFILVLIAPAGVTFVAFGYVGLRFQSEIILDAINDRNGLFVREFDFNEIERNDFPVLSRLRNNGVGDVILGQDGHWEYDIDFPNSPWFKINAVGFLSVPDARQVSKKVKQVIAS